MTLWDKNLINYNAHYSKQNLPIDDINTDARENPTSKLGNWNTTLFLLLNASERMRRLFKKLHDLYPTENYRSSLTHLWDIKPTGHKIHVQRVPFSKRFKPSPKQINLGNLVSPTTEGLLKFILRLTLPSPVMGTKISKVIVVFTHFGQPRVDGLKKRKVIANYSAVAKKITEIDADQSNQKYHLAWKLKRLILKLVSNFTSTIAIPHASLLQYLLPEKFLGNLPFEGKQFYSKSLAPKKFVSLPAALICPSSLQWRMVRKKFISLPSANSLRIELAGKTRKKEEERKMRHSAPPPPLSEEISSGESFEDAFNMLGSNNRARRKITRQRAIKTSPDPSDNLFVQVSDEVIPDAKSELRQLELRQCGTCIREMGKNALFLINLEIKKQQV
ncbi:hypothetical protein WN51_02142 [Melipona quadrifasciata]|uniref:Uncharacterized protein n=1 Tax=Melipona quadrifasciata TaxID=166423 RepID=A0A0N0BDN6_9HYME|nr:hypothetical protein WN51_02142 [Melipona quadrifasciata]